MTPLVRRILLTAATGAYTLGFCEVCVRVLSPQPLMPRYITGTEWGVRGNIPHAVYHHWTPEVAVEYRINGQGMRLDREVPEAKPPGTCRIAVFGDSFFVGYELDLKDAFATRLESALRTQGGAAEVLNFSVSGFGTSEMLRTYERYARKFAPDLALFEWHSTDLEDNVRAGLHTLDEQGLKDTGGTYLPSVKTQDTLMKSAVYRFVADHSQLYAWARERLASMVKKAIFQAGAKRSRPESGTGLVVEKAEETPVDHYPARLSAAILAKAQQEVRADGASFLIVDMPDANNRTTFVTTWDRLPQDVVGGMPVVHGVDVFRPLASPDTKIFYERGHGHITPIAAHALAEATARTILESGALSRCTGGDARASGS